MNAVLPSFCTVRSYQPGDRDACRRLYHEGLLGGKLADNDTGCDLDDIDSAYMKAPGSHFWVAQPTGGPLVGMIGVQHHDDNVGEIRRLRVTPEYRRRGVGTALVETALRFCEGHQYLKITLDTYIECDAAVKLFEKFRFRHERTRDVGGRQLMYFYLDLYSRDQKPAG